MASKIRRIASDYAFSITNSTATSYAISFNDESSFVVYIPSGWTTCTLTVYAKNPSTAVWQRLNYNGAVVSFSAAANEAYTIHESVFPCKDIMLVSDQSLNNALTCHGTSKA